MPCHMVYLIILITDSPYFYLALTLMILGTQLFLAGFIGELIAGMLLNAIIIK